MKDGSIVGFAAKRPSHEDLDLWLCLHHWAMLKAGSQEGNLVLNEAKRSHHVLFKSAVRFSTSSSDIKTFCHRPLELLGLEDSRSSFWLLGWCNIAVIYSDRAVVSQHKWNSGLVHTFLIRCGGTCSFKPWIMGEGYSLGSRLHTWDILLVENFKLWVDLVDVWLTPAYTDKWFAGPWGSDNQHK